MTPDFTTVTELSGDDVSAEQVARLAHRYVWASKYCADKDVLEVACGNGQGLGLLAAKARSLKAGDIGEEMVARARAHYGDRMEIEVMDAQALPMANNSLDVVILFEALYYVPGPERFFSEARRVLRPGGYLLVVSANKDMGDFNPSPHSHEYHGAVELAQRLSDHHFDVELSGSWPYERYSPRQRLLRPIKKMAVTFGFMPKTMAGKKLLKRVFFGSLGPMPAEIREPLAPYTPPVPISGGVPDRQHRVLYCAAQRRL